ncbi:hypothetical protein DBIPINDM_004653 [Mesorhizobium sp. AR02]|uniref:hypothetical protein n=1 Tax=Mesorhizobium sp. AR02 TaxID=2865837 RepID=UPI002160C812|nr:hypothetical protein [Mesorhizobium sp. AR02]UVK51389.1 hypothetical protein DBIPINDM_004653 [Mesorhizobium sp. AR02]
MDFAIDKAGDIVGVMEDWGHGRRCAGLPPPRSRSVQDIAMFSSSLECRFPFDFYDISMNAGLAGALASAGT